MAAEASRRLLTDALEVHHPGIPMEFHPHEMHPHHHDISASSALQHPSPSKLLPPGYQELLNMGDQLLASAQKGVPPPRKKARATPYNARKPAYNKVIEDKDEAGKKRMRKSLMEIKKCSRKEDPETGKIKVNENGAAKRRMLSLKDKVLEVAELVVGKNAADLVTSDVEMALAFVLERKIYGVSVKNVLEHLPEKHPQSLDAMEKQFQKNVRQDFTNERIFEGPVSKAGLTKEALMELKKLDTHDVIAATGSGIRSLKKGPPKKRKLVKTEEGQHEEIPDLEGPLEMGGDAEVPGGKMEHGEDPPLEHEEVEQGQELEAGVQAVHAGDEAHALLGGMDPALSHYEEE